MKTVRTGGTRSVWLSRHSSWIGASLMVGALTRVACPRVKRELVAGPARAEVDEVETVDHRRRQDIEDEFPVQRDQAAGDVLVAGGDANLRRVAVDDEGPEDGELVGLPRFAADARQDGG